MISAVDEIDSVVRCIELGAEDYLPKPFNPTCCAPGSARAWSASGCSRPGDGAHARITESLEQQTATLGRAAGHRAARLRAPAGTPSMLADIAVPHLRIEFGYAEPLRRLSVRNRCADYSAPAFVESGLHKAYGRKRSLPYSTKSAADRSSGGRYRGPHRRQRPSGVGDPAFTATGDLAARAASICCHRADSRRGSDRLVGTLTDLRRKPGRSPKADRAASKPSPTRR